MSAATLAEVLTPALIAAVPEGLVSVYLFGSHAENRAHQESDIDIGVLLRWDAFPTARERFEERLRLIGRFSRLLNSNQVDLVILNDVPPELGRAIVTRGIRVYCADAGLDHTYVRDIQLLAADLEPFLRRARRVKLQALLGK